jgi:hypothetical protein
MGHEVQTQVQLNKANFDVIKSIEGEATANYFLGIGLSKENLIARAKKDMLNKGIIREIEGFSGRNTRYELNYKN